jgi:hypothetical protein
MSKYPRQFLGYNFPIPFPSHNTAPDFSHCDTKRKGSLGLGKLVRDARVYLKSVCESSKEDVKRVICCIPVYRVCVLLESQRIKNNTSD